MAKIVLGITGGIAAFKACAIISKLKIHGYDIQAIMTLNALKFITEMSVASLSKNRVFIDFSQETEGEITHITQIQNADVFITAPATANIIGKYANGIADDFLATAYLAATCPMIVAPSMNTAMWESKSVQRNIATLVGDGVKIIHPREGMLACNTSGKGKLAKIEEIVAETIKNVII